MMKRYLLTIFVSTVIVLFSTSVNACVKVAYSRTTGEYGSGSESGSCSYRSEDSALSSCGKSDCQIELEVYDQCGSIARKTDDTKFIVSAKADDRNDAGNKAMAACGSNCKLITTVCD
jgi:hypothetical protein